MSLNNLNTYQKPVINMAEMCLARLEHGELAMDIPVRNAVKRSREWKDLNGNDVDDKTMINLSGLTRVSLLHLWNKYDGNCDKILTNHGTGLKARGGRSCSKYRNKEGNRIGQVAMSKLTGIGRAKLSGIFHNAEFDHVKAWVVIDEIMGAKI